MESMEETPGGPALADESEPSPADRKAAEMKMALMAVALPAWRKAYLSELLASGRRFAALGNGRGAEYCFAKVGEALRTAPSAAAPETGSAPRHVESDRPVERARRQLRQERIEQAERVLDSHGARLSGLEKKTYRDRLAKLRAESSQPSQAGKADAGLLDLRRRLYHRVLKSQKATLLRKRAPDAARAHRPARISATPTAWQPVTGPYNDRSNLEELLSVLGAADPAWVEEFLELYGDLIGLSALLPAGTAPKK